MQEDEKRQALEELYESLSPEERRRRIVLEPAYCDAYNELVQADRIAVIPQYFSDKWVPVLGLVAAELYRRLRQYCYYNPKTGEQRNECWPKQETLAREIGIKDRKTIRKGLERLEEFGFIRRKSSYYRDESGRPHQGTDHYEVFFEIPLVAEDAAELLIRETTPKEKDGGSYEGRKSPHKRWTVDKPPYEGKKSPRGGEEKIPSRSITRTITPNVTNVESRTSRKRKKGSLRDHPVVQAMKPDERSSREGLALEIGESLKTWDTGWDGKAHKSEGLHRRIAFLMPENLIREALAATRDAVERRRSGEGGCHQGPSAYFAGAVQKIAERDGIELGVNWGKRSEGKEAEEFPGRHPRKPESPRKSVLGLSEGSGMDEREGMPESAREALRALSQAKGS